MEFNIKESIDESIFYLTNTDLADVIRRTYYVIKICALGEDTGEIYLEKLGHNNFVFNRASALGKYMLRVEHKSYRQEFYEYTNYKIYYQYYENMSSKITTLEIVEFDKRLIRKIYVSSEVGYLVKKFLGIKTRRNWINWLYLKLSKVIKYI